MGVFIDIVFLLIALGAFWAYAATSAIVWLVVGIIFGGLTLFLLVCMLTDIDVSDIFDF